MSTATPTKQMRRGCSRWRMSALCPWGRGRDGGNPLSHGLQPISGICGRHQDPRRNPASCVSEKMSRTLHALPPRLNLVNVARHLVVRKSGAGESGANPGERNLGAIFLGPLSLTLMQGSIPVNTGFSFLAPEGCAPISQDSKWRFVSQWHVTLDVIYKSVIKGLFGYLKTLSAYLS